MKLGKRRRAVELLRKHPGWSDRRIARMLGVSHTTVMHWRYAEGLGVYSKRVEVEGREQLVALGFRRRAPWQQDGG